MAEFRDFISWLPVRLPADLAAVLLGLVLTDISLLTPIVRELPFRIVTGFGILLFLPGYVLTALIFPEGGGATASNSALAPESSRRGIDGIERTILSIALSLVIVMATALGLDVAGIGITLKTTLVALNVIIVALTVGATIRRFRVPSKQQYQPAIGGWLRGLRADITNLDGVDRVLSALLLGLILFAVVGTVYTAAVPSNEERFTEFYLLAEGPDGELGATEYPTDFTVGESRELVVGLDNHEAKPITYTVVVELQNVTRRSPDATVLSERELHRFQTRIQAGESWQKRHVITPQRTGTNLRLQYLLYRGDVPTEPTRETAYRRLHLWINVSG